MPSLLRTSNAIHKEEYIDDESRPSPRQGHGVPIPMETKNAIYNREETDDKFGPSPREGHDTPLLSGGL